MTSRDVFKDLCGIIFTGESRNVFASRKDFVCVEELVSTSRSPDRNLLTDFGSPPIPFRALCIVNADFRDMALLGKEINPPTVQPGFFRPTREASKTDHTEFFLRPVAHQK
ncbi:hypothetical protein TNCV_2315921 [Trichonephila clavipes]|nr:hypothetical protein TNCV_2315921 [Trichonephila clavipes]